VPTTSDLADDLIEHVDVRRDVDLGTGRIGTMPAANPVDVESG
jgi:hypothetical protein